jgi:hypothetical protein
MKKYLVGVLIGALAVVSVGAFFYFRPRPDPIRTETPGKTVIESPNREQKQRADVTLSKESETRLSGKAHTPITSLLKPGDSVEIPVAGFVSTVYKDADTGDVVGRGEHSVSGKTTVTVEDDGGIRADTGFEDSFEIAVSVPEKEKRWRVGAMVGMDAHGDFVRQAYGQYDAWRWSGKKVDLAVPVRVEWTAGDGCRVMAGIEIRW